MCAAVLRHLQHAIMTHLQQRDLVVFLKVSGGGWGVGGGWGWGVEGGGGVRWVVSSAGVELSNSILPIKLILADVDSSN